PYLPVSRSCPWAGRKAWSKTQCYLSALGDPFGFVERPVNAEVDAALTVFFFGLRQRGEAAGQQWAYVALIVHRNAIELIRNKSESDVVFPVEPAQHLKHRAPESGVAGGIRREGRREIRTGQIARRCAQRREGRIPTFAHAGDGTAELVEVFRLPDRHPGIG